MRMDRLSHPQRAALEVLSREPQKRGRFASGWGPILYGDNSNRVKITEATANALIARKWAVPARDCSELFITTEGRVALERLA